MEQNVLVVDFFRLFTGEMIQMLMEKCDNKVYHRQAILEWKFENLKYLVICRPALPEENTVKVLKAEMDLRLKYMEQFHALTENGIIINILQGFASENNEVVSNVLKERFGKIILDEDETQVINISIDSSKLSSFDFNQLLDIFSTQVEDREKA